MSTHAQFIADPQVVSFTRPIRAYGIHNAKLKPVTTRFCGSQFTVPPVDVLGPRPVIDADGEAVPGTIVIEDIFGGIDEETGEEIVVLDALRCVSHILGFRPTGNAVEATSSFAETGLSFLPLKPTKAAIDAIKASGQQRARVHAIQIARHEVATTEMRVAKAKQNGVEYLPPNQTYYEAVELLQREGLIPGVRPEIRAGEYPASVVGQPIPVPAVAPELDVDDALEMEAYCLAKAKQLVAKTAARIQGVDKMALLRELLDDPETRLKMQKEYKVVRRKGYRQLDREELQEIADKKQTISGAGLEDVVAGVTTDASVPDLAPEPGVAAPPE